MSITKQHGVISAVVYGIESVLMAFFLYFLTGGMISWFSFVVVVVLGVCVKALANENGYFGMVGFLFSLPAICLMAQWNWLIAGLLFLAFTLIGFNFPFKGNR